MRPPEESTLRERCTYRGLFAEQSSGQQLETLSANTKLDIKQPGL